MTTIIAPLETKNQKNPSSCVLCEQPLGQNASEKFCCKGCEAVYQILATQKCLEMRGEHPLFLQAVKYGVISNPSLKLKLGASGKERYALEIRGMWCPACATLIALLLTDLPGMNGCRVDYMTDFAAIEFDPMQLSKERIRKTIETFGYQCFELNDPKRKAREFSLYLRLAVAFFCAMNVMMFTYPLYTTFFDFDGEKMAPLLAWISLALTLPVITYSAMPIYRRLALSIKQGKTGMETLVVIGLTASMALSLIEMIQGTYHVYFDTVTMLVTLLLLGKVIEQGAKFSAKEAWYQLHRTLPNKARKRDGSIVPLKEILEGDELMILQGEKIPLDGIVLEGEGACDESSLTGEAMPIPKRRGDSVISGALLQTGVLHIQAVTTEEKSSIQQLLNSVETELSHKTDSVTMIDQISAWFTPLVIAIAFSALPLLFVLGVPIGEALIRALAVLLIACPCAIGIAAPLVDARLIRAFSFSGAIVRNRDVFKNLAKATLFLFDKTGTLTEGELQVVKGIENASEKELIAIKSLASLSTHPIAIALQKALPYASSSIENFQETPGLGMQGSLEGKTYCIGSVRFMQEQCIECPSFKSALTTAHVACDGVWICAILCEDRFRKGAESLPVRRLLVSGDHHDVVALCAEQLGFKVFYAGMTPADKKQLIEHLQQAGEKVVFVGDGINDAPALSKADVGISVVSAADISFHVSDLYLLSGRLDQFQSLQKLSRKGEKLKRQNYFWAFVYNTLGIPLALFGVLSPLFATFAMALSSLIVLLNSRRITSNEAKIV